MGQKIEAQLAEAAVPLTAATLRKPCASGTCPITPLADLVGTGRVHSGAAGDVIER